MHSSYSTAVCDGCHRFGEIALAGERALLRPECGVTEAASQKASLARAVTAAPPSSVMNALHSITSSARASKVGGTSRPSALAVFKFMTRSSLVGC
jgi:hypothetical protein